MHGESTQALSREQAVQAGTVQTPVAEAPVVCEAWAGVQSDGGVNKEVLLGGLSDTVRLS
jgi:hypothetical protein